jgi:hypothetical protein
MRAADLIEPTIAYASIRISNFSNLPGRYPSLTPNQRLLNPPQNLKSLRTPATWAYSWNNPTNITNFVSDQWHRKIGKVRDDHFSYCPILDSLTTSKNLNFKQGFNHMHGPMIATRYGDRT